MIKDYYSAWWFHLSGFFSVFFTGLIFYVLYGLLGVVEGAKYLIVSSYQAFVFSVVFCFLCFTLFFSYRILILFLSIHNRQIFLRKEFLRIRRGEGF